jgi:coenzyme F420-reducing hydrogenase beta subunit
MKKCTICKSQLKEMETPPHCNFCLDMLRGMHDGKMGNPPTEDGPNYLTGYMFIINKQGKRMVINDFSRS